MVRKIHGAGSVEKASSGEAPESTGQSPLLYVEYIPVNPDETGDAWD